jgi:hypothetical protein
MYQVLRSFQVFLLHVSYNFISTMRACFILPCLKRLVRNVWWGVQMLQSIAMQCNFLLPTGRPSYKSVGMWSNINGFPLKSHKNLLNYCIDFQCYRFWAINAFLRQRKFIIAYLNSTCSSKLRPVNIAEDHEVAFICASTVLLLGLGRFFSLIIFYTVGRTPGTGDRPVARPLPASRTAQTQNEST